MGKEKAMELVVCDNSCMSVASFSHGCPTGEHDARYLTAVWSLAPELLRELQQAEFDRNRYASMLLELEPEQLCSICPHRNDKHSMNCIECCPVQSALRIGKMEIGA